MKAKILLISVEPLWPSTHGGRIRTARIAETLAANGFCVQVAFPDRPGGARSDAPEITCEPVLWRPPNPVRRLHWLPWLGLFSFPETRHLQTLIDDFQPDFIYWSHSYLAAIGLRKIRSSAKSIVEFANIERDRFRSIAKTGPLKNRLSARVEHFKARFWERTVARHADMCVAIASADVATLSRFGAEVIGVSNAFQFFGYTPSPPTPVVLSVANWEYAPNREGIEHFIQKHWDKVLLTVPEAKLILVGKGSWEICARLGHRKDVEARGFVDDLSETYRNAALFLAPARSGAGSQLKVAEALAHSRCVVGPAFLTREVRVGLPAGAIVASDQTADLIIACLNNPKDRWDTEREIAQYARKHNWQFEAAPLVRWINDRVEH